MIASLALIAPLYDGGMAFRLGFVVFLLLLAIDLGRPVVGGFRYAYLAVESRSPAMCGLPANARIDYVDCAVRAATYFGVGGWPEWYQRRDPLAARSVALGVLDEVLGKRLSEGKFSLRADPIMAASLVLSPFVVALLAVSLARLWIAEWQYRALQERLAAGDEWLDWR
ncbi:MAG: hypothetical protein QXU26_04325 [Thermofilaceae archaeon]